MEKLRNLQSRDLALEVDRDREQLIQQTMRQINAHFGRRCTTTPMAVHRVKVTFKDEPGEGSGVARSFYTAIAQAFLSNDKLPNLDCVQSVSKGMQASSMCPFLLFCFICLFILVPPAISLETFEVKQKLFLLFNFF